MAMRVRNHVICSSPDCDWGCYLPDLREGLLNECCVEFREHCIESHGLKADDMEANVHLDLIEYTLTLLKQECGTESALQHPDVRPNSATFF
jgi:hypothetical protein